MMKSVSQVTVAEVEHSCATYGRPRCSSEPAVIAQPVVDDGPHLLVQLTAASDPRGSKPQAPETWKKELANRTKLTDREKNDVNCSASASCTS